MPTRRSGISQSDRTAMVGHRPCTIAARFALALLLAGFGAAPARAQTTIGALWDGTGIFDCVNFFGCGQTFRVPNDDNVLQSFTFSIFTQHTLSFEIYALSLGHLEGAALYTAPVGPVGDASLEADDPGRFADATVTVPGGLALTGGARYAAMIWTDFSERETAAFKLVSAFPNEAFPGEFSYMDGELMSCPVLFSIECEQNSVFGDDLAFSATFTSAPVTDVVPEPVSMLLLGTGLMGLGGTALRRRRKSAGDAAA